MTLEELTLLAKASSDTTFTGAMDGLTTWVSSGVVTLLGWTPDEMIGRPFFDFVHPEDHHVVLAARSKADATGEIRYRVRVRRQDGGYRWVDILLRTRCDQSGEPIGRFGSWRDVDEEVRLATALEEQFTATARSKERLRATLESMLDPHLVLEAVRDDAGAIVDFQFVQANAAAVTFYGVGSDALIGATLKGKHPSVASTTLFDDYVRLIETGEPVVRDDWAFPQDLMDGVPRRYDFRAVKIDDEVSVTWRDVTERYSRVQRLADSEEHFRLLATNASEMVALWRGGKCVWASPSTVATMGGALDEVIGMDGRASIEPEDLERYDDLYAAAEAGTDQVAALRMRGPNGIVHWVEVHAGPYANPDGSLGAVLSSARVIDADMAAEQDLKHEARHDSLTGLLNRAEVRRVITRLSALHPRAGGSLAVLFCDVDRFKGINDVYGHAAGDEVLRSIGERMTSTIRSDDVAARIGGDEFLVVLNGVHSLEQAVAVAEKIRAATSRPIGIEHGKTVTPGLSIGVTLARTGEIADTLIDRADSAMYEAKGAGRGRVVGVA